MHIPGQSLMPAAAATPQQQQGQSADTQTLLEHQQIIAQTHPDGSFFLTPEGTYVQLVHGVLRTVDFMGQVMINHGMKNDWGQTYENIMG